MFVNRSSASSNENTWYYKWVTRKETRPGAKQKMYTVQITPKIRIDCMMDALIIEFNALVLDFLNHKYVSIHQHRAIQIILNNLQPGQVFASFHKITNVNAMKRSTVLILVFRQSYCPYRLVYIFTE